MRMDKEAGLGASVLSEEAENAINRQRQQMLFSGFGDMCNSLVRDVAGGHRQVSQEDIENLRRMKGAYGEVCKYRTLIEREQEDGELNTKDRVWLKKNRAAVEEAGMASVYTATEAMVLRDLCGAILGVYEFIEGEGGEHHDGRVQNINLAVEANRRFGEFFIGLDQKLGAGEEMYGMFWQVFGEKDFREILEQGGVGALSGRGTGNNKVISIPEDYLS